MSQNKTSFITPKALLSMMRLPNCIMIGFAVIVGEIIASPILTPILLIYGFMAGFLLIGSSMIFNDYYDREIDAINSPERPLPAGLVIPSQAVSFAAVLAALGFLCAVRTGIATLIIAVLSMVIGFAYNSWLKKSGLFGNILVSLNVAVPFVYGGFATGSNHLFPLLVFSTLAFLSSLGREIVKGIVDVQGDAAKGVKSIAVTLGSGQAAKRGAVLFLIAVALSILPLILGIVSTFYIPLVLICDVGFLLTSYSIVSAPTPQNAKRNKKFVLVWMLFGLLAFVVGTV